VRIGVLGLLVGLLALSVGPVAAQDASAEPVERRDLYLDMPYNMGGYEPTIEMTRGAEHFSNLVPGNPAHDAVRADLENLVAAAGRDIEDMVSGYAVVSQDDLFSFVVALRVAGAEPGTLLPAYLPTLYGDLIDPVSSDAVVGGKEVIVISTTGDEVAALTGDEVAALDLYVYDAGDTVWVIQGPEDVVSRTIEELPTEPTPGG
jgi:hypothetical protein